MAPAGRIIVAMDKSGNPVTADDLGVAGAMMVLLKDAIKPNLMQTLEGQPAFVHAGPFANIAHGNNSIIADRIALKLADYVVTESGFARDIGMEKFFDIKCRTSGLVPNCVVLVATIRALKMHGGGPKVVAGKPLDDAYTKEEPGPAGKGPLQPAAAHRDRRLFGVPVVVAVNNFATDTPQGDRGGPQGRPGGRRGDGRHGQSLGRGRKGRVELAEAVIAACEKPSNFKFLYPLDMPIKEKIETIAKKVYQAAARDIAKAEKQIATYERAGLGQSAHLHGQDAPVALARPKR